MTYILRHAVESFAVEPLFERVAATLEQVLSVWDVLPKEDLWARGVRERVRSLVNTLLARRGEYLFSLADDQLPGVNVGYRFSPPVGYHSPLPFRCDTWGIYDSHGHQVGFMADYSDWAKNRKANAVFVTQACNSHHAFVQACSRALNTLEDRQEKGISAAVGILTEALNSVLPVKDSYFSEEKNQLTFNDLLVKKNRKKVSEFACGEIENAA